MSSELSATRRSLLKALVGTTALAGPAWITAAYASIRPKEEVVDLFDAYRRAKLSGRPLLVLIIPENNDQRWDRGRLLGALINHGGDDVLAALATVSLACASTATLAKLGPKVTDSVWMALVSTDAVPATVTTATVDVDVAVEPDPSDWAGAGLLDAQLLHAREAVLDLLLGQVGALESRVAQGRAAQSLAHAQLEQALIAGLPSVAQAGAAPARTAMAIRDAQGGRRSNLTMILADAGRAEHRDQRVSGSQWANGHGCGVSVEGVESGVMGCGMGRVPAKAVRFLYWFEAPIRSRLFNRTVETDKHTSALRLKGVYAGVTF